jgi:hypothetical protein
MSFLEHFSFSFFRFRYDREFVLLWVVVLVMLVCFWQGFVRGGDLVFNTLPSVDLREHLMVRCIDLIA